MFRHGNFICALRNRIAEVMHGMLSKKLNKQEKKSLMRLDGVEDVQWHLACFFAFGEVYMCKPSLNLV